MRRRNTTIPLRRWPEHGNAAGVGATVVVQVLKNSVQAGIGDDGVAFASGDVRVAAQSRAQVALAGLAFGIAGTAAGQPGRERPRL